MPVLISPSTEKVTTKVRCKMKLPHEINKYFCFTPLCASKGKKSLTIATRAPVFSPPPFAGNNQSDSVTMQYLSQSLGLLNKHHTI